jgi:hypothetical protein
LPNGGDELGRFPIDWRANVRLSNSGLGASKTISEINSSWLQVYRDFVFLPPTVKYYIGTKSNNFKIAATITQPPRSVANQTRTLRAINLRTSGRYVTVEVTSSSAWTMLDEIEVRGL